MDVPHSSDVPHVAISNPTPLPFTDHRRTGTKSALPVQFSRFLTGNLLEWAQGGVLGRRCENLISCTRGSNPDRRRHQRLHRTANTAGPSPHPHRRKPILAVSPDASRPPLTPPPGRPDGRGCREWLPAEWTESRAQWMEAGPVAPGCGRGFRSLLLDDRSRRRAVEAVRSRRRAVEAERPPGPSAGGRLPGPGRDG